MLLFSRKNSKIGILWKIYWNLYRAWYLYSFWALKIARLVKTFETQTNFVWGMWLKVTGKGQGCVAVSIWLHILVILFYPHVDWSVKRLAQESPKKNSTKEKTATDKRRRRFFNTFLYLLGSTTISWMREFFLNTLKWLNPQLRCQKYVNRFMHVFVLIWYFGLP